MKSSSDANPVNQSFTHNSIGNPQSEICKEPHSELNPPSVPVAESNPLRNPQFTIRIGSTFPRCPGETARAYSAFITFFQLGHSRTLQAVADKLDHDIGSIKRWSTKFGWSDRIQSYNAGLLQHQVDADVESQREQAAEWSTRMVELRRQEWTAAQKLLSAVHYYLECYGEEQLQKMTLSQVARALNISSNIGRQAIGQELKEGKTEPAMSQTEIQLTESLRRVLGNSVSFPANVRPSSSCASSIN